jgi:branched-chain amino acid transport system permease protein
MKTHYFTSYRQRLALFTHTQDRVAYALLLCLLVCVPLLASKFFLGEFTYILILCIASIGLMVLTGYTGQVSLGHAAFMAIGAYTHTWLLTKGMPFVLSISLAVLFCAAVGMLLGFPAVRVSGLYLAMVTLSFSFIVSHVISHADSITGGFTGLAVPAAKIADVALDGPVAFYFTCLIVLILTVLALANLLRSSTGRAFIGVRDSEAAAFALGISVARVKLSAFALSAAVTGLSGALLAHHTRYLTPDAFTLLLSMELVLMVVIGGLGSLRGAILGAILISFVPTLISAVKPLLPAVVARQFGLETLVFGAILAFFVLFEPHGLNGRWLKWRALAETFPMYRRDTFRRVKTYMKSERYR